MNAEDPAERAALRRAMILETDYGLGRNPLNRVLMTGLGERAIVDIYTSGGNDGVDMVMNQQVRTPRVQDGEESDLCTQTLWIPSHFEQGLGAGIE